MACSRGWGLSERQLCGQWIIFYLQSLCKTLSRTIYENKFLRFILFSCSLKDLSLVYCLWKFQFCSAALFEAQTSNSLLSIWSLKPHILAPLHCICWLTKEFWALGDPGCCRRLCPQEANMCCVLTLQTGLGRSQGITQSPLGWNGEETSKFCQQQVWHLLGKSWLGVGSTALLLKHLAQCSLCRIGVFFCVPMCDSMIIYKIKLHLQKKTQSQKKNQKNPPFCGRF